MRRRRLNGQLYIYTASLQLETITINFTDAPDAPEKAKEEVRPGQPFIVLTTKPQLEIKCENPIPASGLFTVEVLLSNDDTTKTLLEKLAKKLGIKEVSAVKLYRFEDPVMGPRVLPQFGNPLNGKVQVEEGKFEVDVEKKLIHLVPTKGSRVVIGSQLTYIVE